jgi:hypothetical protein
MQPIIYQVDDLPVKIQSALARRKAAAGQFILAFKTLLKPNATIPLLWFAVLADGIVLLNTHKTRSVYKEFPAASLNSVKLSNVSSREATIVLINADILEKDFVIPISGSIDLNIIKNAVLKAHISVF